jgi:hypothetical protein
VKAREDMMWVSTNISFHVSDALRIMARMKEINLIWKLICKRCASIVGNVPIPMMKCMEAL